MESVCCHVSHLDLVFADELGVHLECKLTAADEFIHQGLRVSDRGEVHKNYGFKKKKKKSNYEAKRA